MLQRKQDMDNLRAQMDEFLSIVIGRRAEHAASDIALNQSARIGLVLLVALVAAVLTLETRRVFHKLTTAYNRQIQEIKLRSEESYAREQWLNTTIRSIGDAVIACDSDGNVEFMNLSRRTTHRLDRRRTPKQDPSTRSSPSSTRTHG